eukprot:5088455-Prymnesium_polylepis.1
MPRKWRGSIAACVQCLLHGIGGMTTRRPSSKPKRRSRAAKRSNSCIELKRSAMPSVRSSLGVSR